MDNKEVKYDGLDVFLAAAMKKIFVNEDWPDEEWSSDDWAGEDLEN